MGGILERRPLGGSLKRGRGRVRHQRGGETVRGRQAGAGGRSGGNPPAISHAKPGGKPSQKPIESRFDSVLSPQSRGKGYSGVPNFSLEDESSEQFSIEESVLRPHTQHRQSEWGNGGEGKGGIWAEGRGGIRPPSRIHIRIRGEYRLKDTYEGLRMEDVTNPDVTDLSDSDLLQTGPIQFDLDPEERTKCASRKQSLGQDLMSSTMISAQSSAIPITINKRKKAGNRGASRPPTAKIEESRDVHPIHFGAFSRADPKPQSKKPPAVEPSRVRTTSSLYRKGATPVSLKSSLDPDFLNLFAKAEFSLRF